MRLEQTTFYEIFPMRATKVTDIAVVVPSRRGARDKVMHEYNGMFVRRAQRVCAAERS